jgi:TRAP-type mannitol/chloroaromatic compound transport system permease large subunit
MSAVHLKGVSPPHVTLNPIFAGRMPYRVLVILCIFIMCLWPPMTPWLADSPGQPLPASAGRVSDSRGGPELLDR